MPSVIDYLEFRARLDPDLPAIRSRRGEMSFAELRSLVRRVAGALRRAGVRPGQTVFTVIADKSRDWILTLALFHEATVSCSHRGPGAPPDTVPVDWVLADRQPDWAPADRTIVIDQAWLGARLKGEAEVDFIDYASGDAPARLVLTSGTTGTSKAILLSVGQILGRAISGIALRGMDRTISTLGLSTAADLNSSLGCLIAGVPVHVANTPRGIVGMLREHRLQSLFGSPAQIAAVVRELTETGTRLTTLEAVRYAGSAASPQLLASIAEHLSPNITNLYGSTEAGGMGVFRPDARTDPEILGYPQPDATIEIVDETGVRVPPGEEGLLRVRTPYMAHEYLGDPEATAKAFVDGWFYPGDRARQLDGNLLALAGRESEVINLGGVKVSPVALDAFLLDYPGIEDAAVFGMTGANGAEFFAAALVAGPGFELQALVAALRLRFGKERRPSRFFRVERIPRNAMGKVMRADLARMISAGGAAGPLVAGEG